MESTSLATLTDELLTKARSAHSGRAAHTVHGGSGHHLRQTVIALTGGSELAEHESPSEATLQVLHGRVRISSADDAWEGAQGDVVTIPDARHGLSALEDSAVLLTVLAG